MKFIRVGGSIYHLDLLRSCYEISGGSAEINFENRKIILDKKWIDSIWYFIRFSEEMQFLDLDKIMEEEMRENKKEKK